MIYLTKILKETIKNLQENSDRQPIIIVQSDTGPSTGFPDTTSEVYQVGRMSIFNAYYFPNQQYDLLFDDITPVNSFRIVFDTHFQTNYGLVDDRVFYITYEKPYELIEINELLISNKFN